MPVTRKDKLQTHLHHIANVGVQLLGIREVLRRVNFRSNMLDKALDHIGYLADELQQEIDSGK